LLSDLIGKEDYAYLKRRAQDRNQSVEKLNYAKWEWESRTCWLAEYTRIIPFNSTFKLIIIHSYIFKPLYSTLMHFILILKYTLIHFIVFKSSLNSLEIHTIPQQSTLFRFSPIQNPLKSTLFYFKIYLNACITGWYGNSCLYRNGLCAFVVFFFCRCKYNGIPTCKRMPLRHALSCSTWIYADFTLNSTHIHFNPLFSTWLTFSLFHFKIHLYILHYYILHKFTLMFCSGKCVYNNILSPVIYDGNY